MKPTILGTALVLTCLITAKSAHATAPPETPEAVLMATWPGEMRSQKALLVFANWNGHQYRADNVFQAPRAIRVPPESQLSLSITKAELPDEATIWVWKRVNPYGAPRNRPNRYSCSLVPAMGEGCSIVLELSDLEVEWKLALDLGQRDNAYIATHLVWGNERLTWNSHLNLR